MNWHELRREKMVQRAVVPLPPPCVLQILMDELGRGTSNLEGLAIAWAVAEKLLSSYAYTLFVTHYSQIPALADLYPSVKNV